MYKYIYLFRHGQTQDNANGVFSGWRDSKLTKKGIDDAKIIAIRLKNKKFQVAYESTLSRSKDTLKEILKFHPECTLTIEDDRIIERSYGKLQGVTHLNYIKKNNPEKYDTFHRGYKKRPTDGESIKMVEKRINNFIKDLLKLIKKEKVNVAISAHGNSMRPFRKYFEKLTTKEMLKLENPFDNYFEYKVKV